MVKIKQNPVVSFRTFGINDYDAVMSLWKTAGGIRLRDADSQAGTQRYLERNPGTSFVAVAKGRIIGIIMAGHDGRRGYIYHLTVDPAYQNRGIARELVKRATTTLQQAGIPKCVLEVIKTNEAGITFWESLGWNRRNDLLVFDQTAPGHPNA